MPSSPSPARTAPLRVTHTSAPKCCSLRHVVVVAVHRHRCSSLNFGRCSRERVRAPLHHHLAVGARVVLRPADRLDVVVEERRRLPAKKARSWSGRWIAERAHLSFLRARSMKYLPIALPMPREPECSITQTRSASSRQTSMKWLPPPSVPSWRASASFARRLRVLVDDRVVAFLEPGVALARLHRRRRVARDCRCGPWPCGTLRSIAPRNARKLVRQIVRRERWSAPPSCRSRCRRRQRPG